MPPPPGSAPGNHVLLSGGIVCAQSTDPQDKLVNTIPAMLPRYPRNRTVPPLSNYLETTTNRIVPPNRTGASR
jgi:hypothetical protein